MRYLYIPTGPCLLLAQHILVSSCNTVTVNSRLLMSGVRVAQMHLHMPFKLDTVRRGVLLGAVKTSCVTVTIKAKLCSMCTVLVHVLCDNNSKGISTWTGLVHTGLVRSTSCNAEYMYCAQVETIATQSQATDFCVQKYRLHHLATACSLVILQLSQT